MRCVGIDGEGENLLEDFSRGNDVILNLLVPCLSETRLSAKNVL